MAQNTTMLCTNCDALLGIQYSEYLVIESKVRVRKKLQFACIRCSAELMWEYDKKSVRLATATEVTK